MPIDDHTLVRRALSGDQEAYREIVNRYQRPIFSLILRMVRDRSLAEELAQDAFVKAFTRLESFDPSHKLSSWLFKIAHNTAIDQLRRRRVDTVPIEGADDDSPGWIASVADESEPSPERRAAQMDLMRGLEVAVGRLRPDYREVILLRFQEGLAYDEIAEVTGLPLGTVKTHIHRARKELAETLREMGIDVAGRL